MGEEKIYTVSLNKAFDYLRTKRVRRAVALLRKFVARHGKVAEKNVRISAKLNTLMWINGVQKPPRKVKIRVVKEGEIAKAYLHDEQVKKAEMKKEEKKETPKEEVQKIEANEALKEEKKDVKHAPKSSEPTHSKRSKEKE